MPKREDAYDLCISASNASRLLVLQAIPASISCHIQAKSLAVQQRKSTTRTLTRHAAAIAALILSVWSRGASLSHLVSMHRPIIILGTEMQITRRG
jgi:hypothetical protein